MLQKYQNGETDDEQEFLNALRSSIEIFVNRMKSNSQRSRSIANDSSVQTLFMTINAMHPRLMKYIADQEDARGMAHALYSTIYINLLVNHLFPTICTGELNPVFDVYWKG